MKNSLTFKELILGHAILVVFIICYSHWKSPKNPKQHFYGYQESLEKLKKPQPDVLEVIISPIYAGTLNIPEAALILQKSHIAKLIPPRNELSIFSERFTGDFSAIIKEQNDPIKWFYFRYDFESGYLSFGPRHFSKNISENDKLASFIINELIKQNPHLEERFSYHRKFLDERKNKNQPEF